LNASRDRDDHRAMKRRCSVLVLVVCACTGRTSVCPPATVAPPSEFGIALHVRSRAGAPLAQAEAEVAGAHYRADAAGVIKVGRLDGPALAVVSAPGHLAEPVPLAPSDAAAPLEVDLWLTGEHMWSMSSAGDVMFGRRYETPTEGDPLIPSDAPAQGAADVVAAIAPGFRAADVQTVNLETVLTNRGLAQAYPKKRFILRSRPPTTTGLLELGVDVVNLANNHQRDFLDDGIADTLAAVEAAGLPATGATASAARAPDEPVVVSVRGVRIGFLSWTTVEGSFVNDSYPASGRKPDHVDPADAWQYEERSWGAQGDGWSIERAPRRVGAAWREFAALEPTLAADEAAQLYASLSAVYPEIQDWTARRGHGGAAMWQGAASAAKISALRGQVDVVIVQVHAGFQFMEAPSAAVQSVAHQAIDAGADLVLCHHPHVLQGLEWYKGKLIAFSLGNFVFDQDFLSTFASVVLRTVWDGNRLLEARLLPVEIDSYKPAPAVGAAARRTLYTLWERSVLGALAARGPDGGARAFEAVPAEGVVAPGFRIERHTAVLAPTPAAPTQTQLVLAPGEIRELQVDGLVDSRLGLSPGDPGDLWIGRDVFGWGDFEDELADGRSAGDTHWAMDSCPAYERIETKLKPAAQGDGYLALRRDANNRSAVLSRPVARIPLAAHRLWTRQETPLDPAATYTLRLWVRLATPAGQLRVRLDFYHFDDSNPAEDPSSLGVGKLEQAVDVPTDDAWHLVDIDVPPGMLGADDAAANMVLINLLLDAGGSEVAADVDGLRFIEWREAVDQPARFGQFTHARNVGSTARTLVFDSLPAGASK
jgi:poly-gamma-glutamate capsule biosynthesis protein CapA/YwtB (metallophosphatase superfamily)